MLKVTVTYNHPTDPEAFETYYTETHLPLAAKMPHVAKIETTKQLMSPEGGKPENYRIAQIYYATEADLKTSMGSPEGQATVADIANFATGGVSVVIGQVEG